MANKRLGGQRKKKRDGKRGKEVGGKAIRILNLMYAANCA